MLASWKKSYDKTRQHIKKQRYGLANRGLYSQSYGFSSSHVWMWELDHKEGWALKNWCFQTVVLEKTLESPLDINEVNPKGRRPFPWKDWCWSWSSNSLADAKSQLIGEDPDAGKDWRQEDKVVTEDEMVGWHRWLNEHEFEPTTGDSEGQGSLVCYSPWGCKESQTKLTDWTTRGSYLMRKMYTRMMSYNRASRLQLDNSDVCLWLFLADKMKEVEDRQPFPWSQVLC